MSAANDSLPESLGATLGASFRVERELKGGGMSRVFLVSDDALGRHIIVKVLAPALAEGVSQERFMREIRTLARLQHPHIVPVLSAGLVAGLPYYTMPYVAGESARARLDSGTMPIREVVSVLRDVAKALEFAHAQGVVHRDIKPDNVLLSGTSAVVSDFGIAKAVTSSRTNGAASETLTTVGSSVGTPAYMAPEQALADPAVDHRADIYAFGVTAYELLTNMLPFAERTASALMKAHIGERPTPILSRRSDIPPQLARLVMRCLEKDPARRPASASELVQSLDSVSGSFQAARVGRRRIAAPALAALLAVGTIGAILWRARRGDASTPAPAVAVLPFENLSGDSASEYFSDGMTEQLLGDLSRASGLRVAPRTASFALKGRHVGASAAAAQLHVDHVVTGSVRRAGDRVRIEVQLVDRRDTPRWSRRFDRRLDDIFAVQEEIARAITSALKASLAPNIPSRATDAVTYDLYLRAQHQRRARRASAAEGRARLDSSIALLRQALARDSSFAPAWADLSTTYRSMSEYVLPRSVLPLAKEAARRAVELDPSDGSAGLAFANMLLNVDWNWDAAEREYRRVLELHPDYAAAHRDYASFLYSCRRYDEVLEHLTRADELEWRQQTDTVNLRARQLVSHARTYVLMGREAEARATFERAVLLAPNDWNVHWIYGASLIALDPSTAVRELETTRRLRGDVLPQLTHLGLAYAYAGKLDSARSITAEVMRRARASYVPKDQLFMLYLVLGDRRTAFRWLEQAIDERHYWLPYLNGNPMTARVRRDPEFRAMMKRIGVPETAL